MTAPSPQRAVSAEEREALAAWLLGRDEASAAAEIDHYARHFAGCLPRWINEHHSGDCTKESHSCVRCIAERTYADTDDLIAKHLAPLLDRITAAETDLLALARMYGEACGGLMQEAADSRQLARSYDDAYDLAAAMKADRDRLADEVADLKKESAFLLDRLHDYESDNVIDDTTRDWYGHVRPSMARLTALIAAEDQAHG